jgi:hypothetical protein
MLKKDANLIYTLPFLGHIATYMHKHDAGFNQNMYNYFWQEITIYAWSEKFNNTNSRHGNKPYLYHNNIN